MIYRVRIVNAASLAYYNMAIAGHNLTLISQGRTPIQPVMVKSIDITASQRFEFLLNTHNMPISTYQVSIVTNWRGLVWIFQHSLSAVCGLYWYLSTSCN